MLAIHPNARTTPAVRAEGARSIGALEAALGPALRTITAQDARGWFHSCAYGRAK